MECTYGATLFRLLPSLPPEIDRGRINGVAYNSLAGQFGLSPSALCRRTKHLARQLDFQKRREDQSRQAALLGKLVILDTRLDRLLVLPSISAPLRSLWAVSGSPSGSTPKELFWSDAA